MTPTLTSAMDIVAVANDAKFLFKKLLRSPEADRLYKSSTPESLLASLAIRSQMEPDTIADLVETYLHLVALSLHGPDAVAMMTESHIPHVQWAQKLVDIMREPQASTSTTHGIFKPYKFITPLQEHTAVTHTESTSFAILTTGE